MENGDSERSTSKVMQEMFLFNKEGLSGKLHNSILTAFYVAVQHDSDSFGSMAEHDKCVNDWRLLGQGS